MAGHSPAGTARTWRSQLQRAEACGLCREKPNLRVPSNTPGFRDAGNNKGYGALREVGVSGFSWSATITDSNAHFLHLLFAGVYPQSNVYRAHAFQLRCLQE